jgi:Zn-dependent protease
VVWIKFSSTEIQDLLIAWIAIALAFAIAFRGQFSFGLLLLSSLITVGLGFLLHELMHKYYAQKFGCWAEFRAHKQMLVLAVLLSFTGIIFAAPGGVYIKGHIDKRKNGIISIAGPITNIVLALIFLGMSFFLPYPEVWSFGHLINSWLALFNLIPFGPLDGSKVFRWSKKYYFLTLGITILVMML